MCELLGVNFNEDIRARFSFKGLMNHSDKNPHGWGIAYYPYGSRAAQVLKEPLSGVDSEMAEFVKSCESIYSSIYISHIRFATSARRYDNTHPFSRELKLKRK